MTAYVVMEATLLDHHGVTHVEAVHEDRGRSKRYLGQLESNADLGDEVHTFGTGFALGSWGEPVKGGWRTEQVGWVEEPLRFGESEHSAWGGRFQSRGGRHIVF